MLKIFRFEAPLGERSSQSEGLVARSFGTRVRPRCDIAAPCSQRGRCSPLLQERP